MKIFSIGVLSLLVSCLLILVGRSVSSPHESVDPNHSFEHGDEVKLENLLTAKLEGVEGTEVVVSRVTIPPNTSLPKHWHPGEEFAYVLEGSVVLWQKGKDDVLVRAGEAGKVPLKQVHTAITKEEGATILVFRVHEEGKPERYKAD